MTRLLGALGLALAALALALPAAAHTRSETHSAWQMAGTAVYMQFTVPDLEAKRITPNGEMPSVEELGANARKFMAAARKRPELGMVSTTFIPSVPQEFINVDREKVLKQGVALTDVYSTIQAYMGGLFVNYYNDFGRTWQVYVEAEAPYRATTNDLGQ